MKNEKEFCTVLTTVSKKEEAILLSKALLEQKLIACSNIIPKITSLYFWKGEIVQDEEFLLILKTKTELFEKIESEIKRIHSYEIPEIICLPVEKGSADYLNWIENGLK